MIAPLAALIRYHEIYSEAPAAEETPFRLSEKTRLLQAMDQNLHRRYLKMHRRHGISTVVPMERGICTGCHMRQPSRPNLVEEDIYECQNCGRFLYDPDVAYEYNVG